MRAQGTQETVAPCSSLHCQHSSWGHEHHCGFVATKSLLTSSVIPAQKNALIWCSGLVGTQHVSMYPWKMLVVGGHVACGRQTRVYQAMRIHRGWRGFVCSYCGLWCGRTGETSVLPQVSADASLVCPVQTVWYLHCSSVMHNLAEPGGGVLQLGKQGLGIVNQGEKNSIGSVA